MATSKDYSSSIIGASDELPDIFCEPCEHDGRRVEAEGYCVDCCEYLCGHCYKNHTRNKAFRHHVLQDKGTMPLNVGEAIVKDVCLQKCSQHPLEIVKYFCWSCDSLGCTACITLGHKQCTNVHYIPKIVEASTNNEEFRDFHEKLNKMCKQIAESKNNVSFLSNMSDELKRVAKTEIKKQRSEINKFFDDLQADMEKKIDETDQSNKSILKTVSKRYDSMSKDLMRLKSDIDTKQNAGQNCEVFIAIKSENPHLEKLDRELQNMGTENKIQKYKLHPLTQIQDMMKTTTGICRIKMEKVPLIMDGGIVKDSKQQLTPSFESRDALKATAEIGRSRARKETTLKREDSSSKSKHARKPTSSPQQAREPASSPQQAREPTSSPQQAGEPTSSHQQAREPASSPQQAREPTSSPQHAGEPASSPQSRYITENMVKKSGTAALKTLSLQTKIDISTSNDSEDPSISGIAVVQEHFAVVGDRYNTSVKVIDTRTKKVTSEMNMGEDVYNVTHVNDDKVAVALFTTIQFLSVSQSGSLSKDYAIDVSEICRDLVYYNRRLIVAQRSKVAILDMQGKVLRTIETDSNGKRLFTSCWGLAMSPDNDTIYVSDNGQHTVTSLTLEGKVKQIYTDTELKHPWGITVDNEGYVYVCSHVTGKIHQLSADCTKLQVFPDTAGISITFSNRNKLYLGWGKDMKIYEIK